MIRARATRLARLLATTLSLLPATATSAPAAKLFTEFPPAARAKPAPSTPDLVTAARPAVVHVRGRTASAGDTSSRSARHARMSVGTGFLIESGGHLLTNEHVIRGVVDLRVRLFDGRELPACVVGADPPTDIALLKIASATPLPVLPFGDSRAVRVGEPTIVIGNPFGFDYSVTAGLISAKERIVTRNEEGADSARPVESDDPGDAATYAFYLQTDAAINLGNSGGPMLDARGAVIGVSAAFWGGPQPAQGIGFAIPIDIVKRLLPRLLAAGAAPRSFLGVDSQPVDPGLAAAFGLPSVRGALLANVGSGSPAAKAGLEEGDVVTAWDGEDLASVEDFKIYAQLTAPGTKVKVRILRAGKAEEKSVTTAAASGGVAAQHPSSCRVVRKGSGAPLGLETAALSKAQRARLPDRAGVVVLEVADGGAALAGLFPGDILLRVGRRPITSPSELLRLVNMVDAARPLPLLVRRDGLDFWVALPRP